MQLDLQLNNTMDDLHRAMQETESFLEANEVSAKRSYAIRLAVEELLSNIIKYAYDEAGAHDVWFSLQLQDPASLTLSDDGKPFNPLEDAPAPVLEGDLEDRPIGGLGLHMIQSMGMELAYERLDGRNVLRVMFPPE